MHHFNFARALGRALERPLRHLLAAATPLAALTLVAVAMARLETGDLRLPHDVRLPEGIHVVSPRTGPTTSDRTASTATPSRLLPTPQVPLAPGVPLGPRVPLAPRETDATGGWRPRALLTCALALGMILGGIGFGPTNPLGSGVAISYGLHIAAVACT